MKSLNGSRNLGLLTWTAIIAINLFAGAFCAVAEETSSASQNPQQNLPQGTNEGTQQAGGASSTTRSAPPALTIYNQNLRW